MNLQERQKRLEQEYSTTAVQTWRNDNPELSQWLDQRGFTILFNSEDGKEFICAGLRFGENSITVYLTAVPEIFAEFSSSLASAYVDVETNYDALVGQLDALMKIEPRACRMVVEAGAFANVPGEFADCFPQERDLRKELGSLIRRDSTFELVEN